MGKDKKNNVAFVSIVAIVAIVALVLLFIPNNKQTTTVVGGEEDQINLGGQASRIKPTLTNDVEPVEIRGCYDSDGDDVYNQGYVRINDTNGTNIEWHWDYCTDNEHVMEQLCDGNGSCISYEAYCGYGCWSGACLEEEYPQPQDVDYSLTLRKYSYVSIDNEVYSSMCGWVELELEDAEIIPHYYYGVHCDIDDNYYSTWSSNHFNPNGGYMYQSDTEVKFDLMEDDFDLDCYYSLNFGPYNYYENVQLDDVELADITTLDISQGYGQNDFYVNFVASYGEGIDFAELEINFYGNGQWESTEYYFDYGNSPTQISESVLFPDEPEFAEYVQIYAKVRSWDNIGGVDYSARTTKSREYEVVNSRGVLSFIPREPTEKSLDEIRAEDREDSRQYELLSLAR
jgi:hypothetical protein